MTKRKKTHQELLREDIDRVAMDIIARAQAMIAQDTPVLVAFRVAISWELEIQHQQSAMRIAETLVKLKQSGNN